MDQEIINAFHKFNSFSDIIDSIDITNKKFETTIIEYIRNTFTLENKKEVNKEEIDTNINKEVNEEVNKEVNEEEIDTKINEEENINHELSDEQKYFVKMALEGHSIFLTAPAGFGKSFVINHLVKELRNKYDNKYCENSKVSICASTGKASSLIGGRTIHSYLGIGLAKQSANDLFKKLVSSIRLKSKYFELRELKVLIIDEISMISDAFIDKISEYLELIHKNNEPFGGIQVIFIGDLFQLQPIEGKFFIDSITYKSLNPLIIQFTKCFRQNDIEFQNILSEARIGKLSDESFKILLNNNKNIDKSLFLNMEPMIICPTNNEVDAINQRELNKLTTEKKIYKIKPIVSNKKLIEMVVKQQGIPEEIKLGINAQIMITTNISQNIVNGSQGIIKEMYDDYVIVRLINLDNDIKIGYNKVLDPDCIDEERNPIYIFEYLPIRLAYANTIHKIQGATCNYIEVNLSKVFVPGQAYVGISRVKTLKGLKITGLKKSSFFANKRVIEFYSKQI